MNTTERKTKTDHTGRRIRNFVVLTKTTRKKQRPNGRNFYIYVCQCDCGTEFDSNSAEFEYRFGCDNCSKEHHYKSASKNQKITKKQKPTRLTEFTKLYPESYDKVSGSYANAIVSLIKNGAKHRGLEWNLTHIETFNILLKACYYCGTQINFPETRNGLDRLDNTKGYISNNVVPCCYPCNIAKHQMTEKEFKSLIINIYNNWASK